MPRRFRFKSRRPKPEPDPEAVATCWELAKRECNRLIEGINQKTLLQKACGRAPKLPEGHSYIYGLVDPRNQLIRYVGRTRKPLAIRLSQHITSEHRGVSYKQRWVRALISKRYIPLIVPICTVPADLADTIERFVIFYFTKKFEPLVNFEAMRYYLILVDLYVRNKLKCPKGHLLPYDRRELAIRNEMEKIIHKVLHNKSWPRIDP